MILKILKHLLLWRSEATRLSPKRMTIELNA